MKSTKLHKIIDETTITLNESRAEVINKLRQQQGRCTNDAPFGYGAPLFFICSQKGEFCVSDQYANRGRHIRFFVKGEVTEENGQTAVKIYSVYEKYNLFMFYCLIVCSIFYTVFAVSVYFKDSRFALIGLILGVVFYMLTIRCYKNRNLEEHKSRDINYDVMKNEVITRVEAIKNWDK